MQEGQRKRDVKKVEIKLQVKETGNKPWFENVSMVSSNGVNPSNKTHEMKKKKEKINAKTQTHCLLRKENVE